MKIHINFNNFENPYEIPKAGGGSSFLTALKEEFKKQNLYTDNPLECDVFLLNSHHNMEKVWHVKKLNSKAVFPHRLDGPHRWRIENDITDKKVYYYAGLYSDGMIFQSEYSKKENYLNGFKWYGFCEIIHNAPNPNFFHNPKNKIKNEKIKIIISSWSNNWMKGYSDYEYLDKNLDFSSYEIIFAGRSPINFKNIKNAGILSKQNLSILLKSSDMFIASSEHDPCSNSVLEALHCNLPVLYKNSGGHKEIVQNGGLGYNTQNEMVDSVEKIALNIKKYQKNIKVESLEKISKKYINFFESLLKEKGK